MLVHRRVSLPQPGIRGSIDFAVITAQMTDYGGVNAMKMFERFAQVSTSTKIEGGTAALSRLWLRMNLKTSAAHDLTLKSRT
jgi:hypothetical protein